MTVSAETREAILNAWEKGGSATEIASPLRGVTPGMVSGMVGRARAAGDPRAMKRRDTYATRICQGGRASSGDGWTAEQDAILRGNADTKTARQIAELIPGCTIDGVRQRAVALKISLTAARQSAGERAFNPFGGFRQAAASPERRRAALPTPVCEPVPLLAIGDNQCRFPMWAGAAPQGDVDALIFCGAPIGSSSGKWCPAHHAVVFAPRQPRSAADLAA